MILTVSVGNWETLCVEGEWRKSDARFSISPLRGDLSSELSRNHLCLTVPEDPFEPHLLFPTLILGITEKFILFSWLKNLEDISSICP